MPLAVADGLENLMDDQRALADRLFPVILEEDDSELRNVPPEQRRLHTETADLTVSSLHAYLQNGKLEIPEFQRGYVWTRAQASRLIESLVIQCPIPVVYFSQTSDGKLLVIDGNQRLSSIKLFLDDAFELQGLRTYPELNGVTWSTLDPRLRDHINNRTIRCITILRETHPQIKFDVFERLNTGSVKLNAQELRHGINSGLLIDWADKQAKSELWKKLTGFRKDTRMKGAELVLRFFAFRHSRGTYEKPLADFLDTFSSAHQKINSDTMLSWNADFESALENIDKLLGKYAFRILDYEGKSVSSFNSALYDAQMIAFAETTNLSIRNSTVDANKFRIRASELINSEKFFNSIRQATSDELSVKTRIEMFKAFLDGYAVQ